MARTVVGALCLFWGIWVFGADLYLLDGLRGWIFSRTAFGGEHTEYSSGYSDRSFRAVRIGMTKQEVRDLLGPPLEQVEVESESLEIWSYSRSPTERSYRVRVLHFGNGVVVETISEFYID